MFIFAAVGKYFKLYNANSVVKSPRRFGENPPPWKLQRLSYLCNRYNSRENEKKEREKREKELCEVDADARDDIGSWQRMIAMKLMCPMHASQYHFHKIAPKVDFSLEKSIDPLSIRLSILFVPRPIEKSFALPCLPYNRLTLSNECQTPSQTPSLYFSFFFFFLFNSIFRAI